MCDAVPLARSGPKHIQKSRSSFFERCIGEQASNRCFEKSYPIPDVLNATFPVAGSAEVPIAFPTNATSPCSTQVHSASTAVIAMEIAGRESELPGAKDHDEGSTGWGIRRIYNKRGHS